MDLPVLSTPFPPSSLTLAYSGPDRTQARCFIPVRVSETLNPGVPRTTGGPPGATDDDKGAGKHVTQTTRRAAMERPLRRTRSGPRTRRNERCSARPRREPRASTYTGPYATTSAKRASQRGADRPYGHAWRFSHVTQPITHQGSRLTTTRFKHQGSSESLSAFSVFYDSGVFCFVVLPFAVPFGGFRSR